MTTLTDTPSSSASAPAAGSPAAADRRRAHYVLSTHWDREWYQAFQDYRFRLVRLLDRVIAGLEDGTLRGPFTCDGQAIILDDYCEIRPEQRDTVARLVAEGRLVVGPWYVLPDEFLVAGESIVRNIRLGRRLARQWGGKPSNAGFVCDLFGHIAQLPQLLAGFGVTGTLVWRGVEHDRILFNWASPDGTSLPAYRFGTRGYCDVASKVRKAFEIDAPLDPDTALGKLNAYLDQEAAARPFGPILVFDGGDHQEWDRRVYQALARRVGTADDSGGNGQAPPVELVHSDLDTFLAELNEHAEALAGCETVTGELRAPGSPRMEVDEAWVIPGVASSRVWIKQDNRDCESLLTQWAEPLDAFAARCLTTPASGREASDYAGFLRTAWTWLLKNHPHDSICGCSIDQVHEDMKFRFSQCRQIAHRIRTDVAERTAAAIGGELGERDLRVTVFNPQPRDTAGPVELDLDIPADYPDFSEHFFFEQQPAFRLFGDDGSEIPYQRISHHRNRRRTRLHAVRFPAEEQVHRVRVAIDASTRSASPTVIPAMGYRAFTVKPGEKDHDFTRYATTPDLAVSPTTLENQHLRVEVTARGALNLTDRATGRTYADLLSFEDTADIGDGWYHGQALADEAVSSLASATSVSLLEHGPLVAALRLRTTLSVPDRFDFPRARRSDQRVDLILDTTVRLRSDQPFLDITTTVTNTARDHRVRAVLPTDLDHVTHYLADQAYAVVRRPVALRPDNHLHRELEIETKPQSSWTALVDPPTGEGLAVITHGLLETAVRNVERKPIALTLWRSTGRTVLTDGEPNGQLLGPMTFRYRIAATNSRVDTAELFRIAQDLHAPPLTHCLRQRDRAHLLADLVPAGDIAADAAASAPADLPTAAGLCRLRGEAILTAFRRVTAQDTGLVSPLMSPEPAAAAVFEARLFNPNDTDSPITLDFSAMPTDPPTRAVMTDLEQQPIDAEGHGVMPIHAGRLELTIPPYRIVTLLIR